MAGSANVHESKATCLCCYNLLRFPSSVPCFRCTVCDCVTDLVPLQVQGEDAPEPLSLEKLRTILERGDDTYVEKVIHDCFASHHSLNGSFSNHSPVTIETTGLNLDDVRESYRLITRKSPKIQRAMMVAIDQLVRRPGKLLTEKEDIKFLIILLQNPIFLSSGTPIEVHYHHDILARVLGLTSCLSNDLHHYVVNWFTRLPIETFQKLVGLVNHFISFRLAQKEGIRESYPSDWATRSAARVMALLYAANGQRNEHVAIGEFYNTMVDYINLHRDFQVWQVDRTGAFSFCQYPFLISLGGKMQIMEADAKRQMAERFKEAFFRTALHGLVTDPFLSLRIRRGALIEDSLNQLQSRHFDLKKKLRIEFVNEDGVDAGGLTKEWFLLLVRDLFDPQYGMFTFDDDSLLCWFNPASFENTEEFRLVGTIIGLAIHNSNILDVHFPPACYKKLLGYPCDLEDLKVLRPELGRGLQQLLDYEHDDVETVFCRDFVAEYDAFGERVRVPLIPNGEQIPVTKDNKIDFVNRFVDWALNSSVETQFAAFKAGFGYVCGGNALSLFKPAEIELMVCGGTELDIRDLEGVTEYEGFTDSDHTIRDFWDVANAMSTEMKRKLLLFTTGTDRIPATGIQNMAFKISCLGEDSENLPTSHTCFNQLCLYRYATREKLERKLEKAITWSSGFHVK
ncbi:hypothetical protein DFS34DRAFT_621504 [Phlyctochytrium arcticum]|nr:hypothetical protein DFS34DRAFT_621504 [Phlyctochytrium arcticum]